MVTKQHQLEWLAEHFTVWPGFGQIVIKMSSCTVGEVNKGLGIAHHITRQEWQQERDQMQMQKQAVQSAQPEQPAPDNSWHERGEFPPAGCECEAEYDTERKEWCKVRIIGVDDGECFFRWLSGKSSGNATVYKRHIRFRPLLTEREKAIQAACDAIDKNGVHSFERGVVEKLYDAGLLKVAQ